LLASIVGAPDPPELLLEALVDPLVDVATEVDPDELVLVLVPLPAPAPDELEELPLLLPPAPELPPHADDESAAAPNIPKQKNDAIDSRSADMTKLLLVAPRCARRPVRPKDTRRNHEAQRFLWRHGILVC
jgi:hypothetical protein